jgi:hypothetical protein
MAMIFKNGTLNTGSSTPARDVRQAWASAIVGDANWSLVNNNYTNGTWERTVIKHNTNDGVLILINSTAVGSTRVYVVMARSYNAGTNSLTSMAYYSDYNGFTYNRAGADGFSLGNYGPTGIPGFDAGGNYTKSFLATTTQSAWSAHIEDDHIIFSFKNGQTTNGTWLFFGKGQSLITNTSISDPYPFFCHIGGGNGSQGGLGGNTLTQVLHSPGNEGITDPVHYGRLATQITIPPASLSFADRYSANPAKGSLAPYYIYRGAGIATDTNNVLHGSLRAKLPNIMAGNATNALWGDTVTIGSKTYMYIGGNITTLDVLDNAATGWAAKN